MSQIIEPKVLKGFRDFLPAAEIQRKEIQRLLEKSFEDFGFVPIDTPAMEYRDVLLGKGGGETDKQVYAFKDNGQRDVALRFDLTVPFARFMAAHREELYLPFKRYHISKVWRGENTQKGRYREFTQCDFDIVGSDSTAADFEILFMMHHSLGLLGIADFHIHVSHRGIFNTFLKHIQMEQYNVEILRAVDKLAKIGRNAVFELLLPLGSRQQAEQILDYIEKEETWEKTLKKITALAGGENPASQRMEEIFRLAEGSEIAGRFVLDPSITRGLDYYDGIVYETFLDNLPGLGSVCSGGRYNNLAGLYTKEELPGVGSSIGLDRLLAGLEELGTLSGKQSYSKVLILNMTQDLLGYYFHLAGDFRRQGIAAEVYPEPKKLKHQFAYGEKKEIPFALICGEDERKQNKLSLKNLHTRETYDMVDYETALKIIGAGEPQ